MSQRKLICSENKASLGQPFETYRYCTKKNIVLQKRRLKTQLHTTRALRCVADAVCVGTEQGLFLKLLETVNHGQRMLSDPPLGWSGQVSWEIRQNISWEIRQNMFLNITLAEANQALWIPGTIFCFTKVHSLLLRVAAETIIAQP